MNAQKKKKAKKRFTGRKLFCTILVIMAVLAVTVYAAYRNVAKRPTLPVLPPSIQNSDGANESENSTVPGHMNQTSGNAPRKSADYYTVLVVGTDEASNSTDTMMLVSYDVTNQKATVMSIPRDTLVGSTKWYTRINSVYAANGGGEEGIEALTDAVTDLVGFRPDFRVFIQWELVGLMVDAIGGVEYDVPYHMEYDDPYQDLHIYVEKGLQKLDGEKAMQLIRWRKNNPGVSSGGGTGSDLNRLKVQQGFLKATLVQMLQIKNLTRIGELAKLFSENVESDLSMENMLWFASKAILSGLEAENVEFMTMPLKLTDVYVYPDRNELLTVINEKLNPYQEDIEAEDLHLIYVDGNGNLCSTG